MRASASARASSARAWAHTPSAARTSEESKPSSGPIAWAARCNSCQRRRWFEHRRVRAADLGLDPPHGHLIPGPQKPVADRRHVLVAHGSDRLPPLPLLAEITLVTFALAYPEKGSAQTG